MHFFKTTHKSGQDALDGLQILSYAAKDYVKVNSCLIGIVFLVPSTVISVPTVGKTKQVIIPGETDFELQCNGYMFLLFEQFLLFILSSVQR